MIFIFSKESRPALGLTQHPAQWVLGGTSITGKFTRGVKMTALFNTELKRARIFTATHPIRFHDSVVMSELMTSSDQGMYNFALCGAVFNCAQGKLCFFTT
jgi:hypothetical protein